MTRGRLVDAEQGQTTGRPEVYQKRGGYYKLWISYNIAGESHRSVTGAWLDRILKLGTSLFFNT